MDMAQNSEKQRQEPLSVLAADPNNARTISPESMRGLSVSIETFGDLSGIVFNTRTRHLVCGHQRVSALREAGAAEWVNDGAKSFVEHPVTKERFGVRLVDWDETTERMANLTANNPSIGGEFTAGALEQLRALENEARYDALGLDALERQLREEVDAAEEDLPKDGQTDPDALPDETEPLTKPGDLWVMGGHRLLCGDSTKVEDVARLMDGAQAECMWTDPPYGVDYVGKTKDALRIKNDGADGLDGLLRGAFAAASGALADGAAIYVAHPAGARSVTFGNVFLEAGWRIHQTLIWAKDVFVLGHSDYHYQHEPIIFGYKPGAGRRGRGGAGWYGDNAQTSVFQVPRPKRSEEHPTMKPVELVSIMLKNSCAPRGLVYEPFSGSGTTLIACERLSRRCSAMELDPRFVDVAVARWEQFTGRKAHRLDR